MPGLADTRILVLDVDGILTDGGLYVGADGQQLKRFAIVDGAGLKELMSAGIRVALISGHASDATLVRFRPLGIEDIETGVRDKAAAFNALLERRELRPEQAAVMGDDLMDLPMIRAAGWSATVPEARPEVIEAVDHVTERGGGRGAVREVAEMILKAQGRWDETVRRYAT